MNDPSLYFWLGAIVVIAFIDLVAIMNLWRSDKSFNTRLMWAVAIIALPVFGIIAWAYAGSRGMPKPPSSPEHSK
ncbi:PLD nuclease N-terminal domain-containing protein [Pseudomonas sp. MM211]|uniref:PLD nuclease N-terminal domain-containing protein n=1 Tax=Pseudomonas sp. MM211 TaxID=2866808 RepID=UPI001CEDB6D8|nr:PLD nuclease N-terminal domain-containing protein [Pseudomonas sp. MM211]UCJ16224.1 PLD nuclease N-terminal domain-containing protein [Pseudomonas sp. MM211]